jgi:hypothetical protein
MNGVYQAKSAKLLAVMLAIGGVLGIGLAIWMGYQFVPVHWIYIVLVVAFLLLFIWSVIAGIRLWRGEPKGWKWATILFALQVPVLTVPGLSYEFYTGLALKIVGGDVETNVGLDFGANANFYLGTEITGLVYGVNLVAVAALIYLVRSRPNKGMQPTAQSTAADA